MIIALAGQPNAGKSTLFNQVAGYKTVTSNFPGKTVKYTKTRVNLSGEVVEVVDLPGTYSLTSFDIAEMVARSYMLEGEADVVVNVVDASLLSRSLELTLQIMELGVPLVLCLNMMDEAERKGIQINPPTLERILGVAVVPCVAMKGKGIREVFHEALKTAREKRIPKRIEYSKDVEEVIRGLEEKLKNTSTTVPSRLLAVKLLENDQQFLRTVKNHDVLETVKTCQRNLEQRHGRPSDVVISSERHGEAVNIYEEAATVREPEIAVRDQLDNVLMHRFLGYVSLAVILYVLFQVVFGAGRVVESLIFRLFESLIPLLPFHGFTLSVVRGIVEGISGGVGIVLPYLVPFLIGLAILEDVGYLPRIAFLTDALLHRIGLHGKAVIPMILGYGCTVPAIMATRILESERDRFITASLSTMIPCAARTTIILGLVAFFISPNAALAVYVFNLAVVVVLGLVLSKMMPEVTPGLILEMPSYHIPSLRSVVLKTWLRTREFIYIAWPILVAGSVILSVMNYLGVDALVNVALSPLTFLLGLPSVVGVTLIFGVFKKELSLIMLIQVLGTSRVLEALTPAQVLTFTVFVIFYLPCAATLGVLAKEFGARKTTYIALMTFGVALFLGLLARIGGMIL